MSKVLVEWSFVGTEFEDTYGQYDEALSYLGLPKKVDMSKLSDEVDEDNIQELLEEEYGFEVESWEFVDSED